MMGTLAGTLIITIKKVDIVKWESFSHRFCVANTIVLAHDGIVKWKRLDPTMLQVHEEHLLAARAQRR